MSSGMQFSEKEIQENLAQAEKGVNQYLTNNKDQIRDEIFKSAMNNVPKKLKEWLTHPKVDELSPQAKEGIMKAIKEKRWAHIVDAFLDDIAFGTGGIRGVAAFAKRDDESELEKLYGEGIGSAILKGPNTINDLVLMIKSAGVAQYAKENGLKSIVIGFDSRIQGQAFAELIAKFFLNQGMTVYLFDEACPYPELTFAIPHLQADMGILISASHNDRRYNGYKLSSRTGAQFEIAERDKIYFQYILHVKFEDIQIQETMPQDAENLIFLGGEKPLDNRDYYGRQDSLVNMHKAHIEHIRDFILDKEMMKVWAPQCRLGFCAYHGAGRKAVPKLLDQFYFKNVHVISSLHELDGRFPCFALEQQPDPGDTIAGEVAVNEFKKEYGNDTFSTVDLIIGTDPDADRAGFIMQVPEPQIKTYQEINKKTPHLEKALQIAIPTYQKREDFSWHLLDADNAWTILLWYRLMREAEKNGGIVPDRDKKFLSLSHTTSDSMVHLVRKHGLGVVKTWVGFAFLANAVYMVWNGKMVEQEIDRWRAMGTVMGTGDPEKDLGKKIFPEQAHMVLFDAMDMATGKRSYNFAALEQSNGFSILGPKPAQGEIWGKGGHVRDKDGTFAAMLIAEVQAYAKSIGKSLIELLDEHIYLDPDIGLYINYYEPEPYWGQFEGPTGMSDKINTLWKVEDLRKTFEKGDSLSFGKLKVLSIQSYRTGKYDALHRWRLDESLPYFNGFPDEGIRFFFDEHQESHLTVRPSGTSQCLRFHVQLKAQNVDHNNLYDKKRDTYQLAKDIVADIRKIIGC